MRKTTFIRYHLESWHGLGNNYCVVTKEIKGRIFGILCAPSGFDGNDKPIFPTDEQMRQAPRSMWKPFDTSTMRFL